MSWEDFAEELKLWEGFSDELDRFLDYEDHRTLGTGTGGVPTEPLPGLWRGVPLFDKAHKWFDKRWGGYGKMDDRTRRPWDLVLGVSRGQPGDKGRALRQLAEWLRLERPVSTEGASSPGAAPRSTVPGRTPAGGQLTADREALDGGRPRRLSDTERKILALCRRRAHKGERIAHHIRRSEEHTRRLLARLVKEGRLRTTPTGYRTV
jgi:hypothetical protein